MSEKEILLVGGGGHCRSCIDVIEAQGEYCIAGVVEQPGTNREKTVCGYPIIGYDSDLEQLRKDFTFALVTAGQIGTSRVRQKLFNNLMTLGFVMPVIISPSALVSSYSDVGDGTIVMHQTVVNTGARVGQNCILNTKSLIEHDVRIGSHTHISTAAVINGGAVVGASSFVGSNATVVQYIVLPDSYFFKAGGLVAGPKDGKPLKQG